MRVSLQQALHQQEWRNHGFGLSSNELAHLSPAGVESCRGAARVFHPSPNLRLPDVWVSETDRPQLKTKVVHLSQLPQDTAVLLDPNIYRVGVPSERLFVVSPQNAATETAETEDVFLDSEESSLSSPAAFRQSHGEEAVLGGCEKNRVTWSHGLWDTTAAPPVCLGLSSPTLHCQALPTLALACCSQIGLAWPGDTDSLILEQAAFNFSLEIWAEGSIGLQGPNDLIPLVQPLDGDRHVSDNLGVDTPLLSSLVLAHAASFTSPFRTAALPSSTAKHGQ
ncbi:hypothetical protein JZ751_009015, partial [Albula glossodonta]